MKRGFVFSIAPFAALTMLVVAGCSREEAPTQTAAKAGAPAAAPGAKAKGPTPVNEADLPRIPILEGYKYYIGGPFLAPDKYGKQRIQKFNDEVAQPPSRGMVFGARRDGDRMEYKVWGNGRILGYHKGVFREGVYWDEYIEGYKDGKVVARETITHDDVAQRSKVITEELDYETGEVIRTKELSLSYLPAALPKEMEDDEDEDEDAPAADAPKAAAPAAAAPPAAAPATPPAGGGAH